MLVNRWAPALLVFVLFLGACNDSDVGGDRPWERSDVDAYVPVYGADSSLKKLSVQDVKPMLSPGKVYGYKQYLVIPDVEAEGLHVIDNTNPATPVKKNFISIPGCAGATVKDHYLYVANYDDLITLDLDALPAIKITGRVKGAFQQALYPPYTNVYFECVDTTRGTVIGWRRSTVKNPKCRT